MLRAVSLVTIVHFLTSLDDQLFFVKSSLTIKPLCVAVFLLAVET